MPDIWQQNTSLVEKGNISNYIKNKIYEPEALFRIQSIYWNNKFIGYIGFFQDEINRDVLFIFYAIHPQYWNKGFATLAIKKILSIFKPLIKNKKYKQISATVKVDNRGSQRVLEKNGFKVKINEDGSKVMEYANGDSLFYFYELLIN